MFSVLLRRVSEVVGVREMSVRVSPLSSVEVNSSSIRIATVPTTDLVLQRAAARRLPLSTREVVRSALDLLEHDAERRERVAKWRRAVGVVGRESRAALRDFRSHSRLHRID